MPGDKERFNQILIKEKNVIEELKKIVRIRESLTSKIKDIKRELGEVQDTLKCIDTKFIERIEQIEKIEDEIKQLNFEMKSEDIEIIPYIIKNNLPDGFSTVKTSKENDEDKF